MIDTFLLIMAGMAVMLFVSTILSCGIAGFLSSALGRKVSIFDIAGTLTLLWLWLGFGLQVIGAIWK